MYLQHLCGRLIVVVFHSLDLPKDLRTNAGHLPEVTLQHDRVLGAAQATTAAEATLRLDTLALTHAALLVDVVRHRSGTRRSSRTGSEVRHRSSIFLGKAK